MANEQVVTSRILIRRGNQIDLPQPLNPGEFGLCVDTGRLFIGAEQSQTIGNVSNVVSLYDSIFWDEANALLQYQFFTLQYSGAPTNSEIIDDFCQNSTPPITDQSLVRFVRNDVTGWAFISIETAIPGFLPPVVPTTIGTYGIWDLLHNQFYNPPDPLLPSSMVLNYSGMTDLDYYNLVNLINVTAASVNPTTHPAYSPLGLAYTNQNIEIFTNFSKNIGGGGGGTPLSIYDEGIVLGPATKLNFVGPLVEATVGAVSQVDVEVLSDAGKINVVSSPVVGNFPVLTATGNLIDSGTSAASFALVGHTHPFITELKDLSDVLYSTLGPENVDGAVLAYISATQSWQNKIMYHFLDVSFLSAVLDERVSSKIMTAAGNTGNMLVNGYRWTSTGTETVQIYIRKNVGTGSEADTLLFEITFTAGNKIGTVNTITTMPIVASDVIWVKAGTAITNETTLTVSFRY